MTQVSIDDKVCAVETKPGDKLGGLLESLTTQLPDSRIVTQVTLNGKPLPKYTQISSLEEDILQIEKLEIRTADRAIWAANGIDIALSCVERVQKSLLRVAELFREEKTTDANRIFAHCMEGMERFLETILITRSAVRLNFTQVHVDGRTLATVESDLLKILAATLLYQESANHSGIADKIEYELIPNLGSWSVALRQIRMSQRSNA